jgi:Flp pilus assembly secretin CpaC
MGRGINLLLVGVAVLAFTAPAFGQAVTVGETVHPLDMAVGRSIPMSTRGPIERVSVADPSVADVVIITERELVVNALKSGTTDLLIWQTDGPKSHYRVLVHSPTDRKQLAGPAQPGGNRSICRPESDGRDCSGVQYRSVRHAAVRG